MTNPHVTNQHIYTNPYIYTNPNVSYPYLTNPHVYINPNASHPHLTNHMTNPHTSAFGVVIYVIAAVGIYIYETTCIHESKCELSKFVEST